MMKASGYTPVKSAKAIPTGEVASVEGTPFDFRTVKPIGRDIEEDFEQLVFGQGYDHNFALDKEIDGVEKVAEAYGPESGILMEVLTDCIGIQFKHAKFTIGYLQLETASSNGNNKNSNFFSENAFTYDTTVISNERMTEVANYVKSRVDAIKKGATIPAGVNNNISVADELLKLKQLLDIGVLTQEEFDKEKIKLLNR